MAASTSGPAFIQRTLTVVLLVAMAGCIAAQRLRLSQAPLHGDICAYALIGHEMLGGRHLYSDLWERKPPLLYATFAAGELIVGYGRSEIFAVGLTFAILTLLALFVVGTAGSGGRTGGLLTAAFWTLLCSDLDLAANQPDPEVFINAFVAAAFATLVASQGRRPVVVGVVVGTLLAASTLYKHNAILVCLALCFANAAWPRSDARRPDRRRMITSLTAVAVIACAWLGLFAYFYSVDRFHDFREVVFNQNFAYSGSFISNLASAFNPHWIFAPFMVWAIGPAALVVAVALIAYAGKHRSLWMTPDRFLWLAWAAGSWATIALTGRFYPHYYQLLIPVWCVAGGWAGAALLRSEFASFRLLRAGLVFGVLLVLLFRQGGQFQLTPDQWVQRQFPYFDVREQNAVGVQLGRLLKPAESFWELGEDNALYFFSKHSPPVGLLFIDPLIYGDQRPAYWRRVMADLDRTKPDLVVVCDAWTKFFPGDTPVFPWIKRNYILCNRPLAPPTYHLWLRRGSDLQLRTQPAL